MHIIDNLGNDFAPVSVYIKQLPRHSQIFSFPTGLMSTNHSSPRESHQNSTNEDSEAILPLSSTSKDPNEKEISSDSKFQVSTEAEPRIQFRCEKCDIDELCDYKGQKPPFANGICFTEDCFVMRDPFAPPLFRARSKPEYFIVLGAHCTVCGIVVCKRTRCSVFYEKTFCKDCALANLKCFPSEVQARMRKQFS